MNIQLLDPKTLVPNPDNPKDHPPEQVQAIAQTIKNFGFDQPVVVDKNMVIIKGHGRTLGSILLGLPLIPVIVRDVTANEARLNMVLDNKLTSRDYDQGALRADLLDLQIDGKLELSLFDEGTIPVSEAVAATPDAGLFTLATDHKCPKCAYRW